MDFWCGFDDAVKISQPLLFGGNLPRSFVPLRENVWSACREHTAYASLNSPDLPLTDCTLIFRSKLGMKRIVILLNIPKLRVLATVKELETIQFLKYSWVIWRFRAKSRTNAWSLEQCSNPGFYSEPTNRQYTTYRTLRRHPHTLRGKLVHLSRVACRTTGKKKPDHTGSHCQKRNITRSEEHTSELQSR